MGRLNTGKYKINRFFFMAMAIIFVFLNMNFFNALDAFPKKKYCLPVGKDILLDSSCKPSGSLDWYSDNSGVASIDSWGIVHGKSIGKTKITAVDKNNHSESQCIVEITEAEPVRNIFVTNDIVETNESFEVKTITPKNVQSIKIEIAGNDYRNNIACSRKSEENGCYVWTCNLKIPRVGKYGIRTYSKVKGSWETCAEGYTEIYISSRYNTTVPSLTEKRVSLKGSKFISSCEGFVSKVYKDPAGFLTIGYGKRIYSYEPFYNNLGYSEGLALFSKTLNNGGYVSKVNNFLRENKIKFNQQQFDALVSFSYNLGCGWLRNGSELSDILLRAGSKACFCQGTVNSSNGLWIRSGPTTSSRRLRALSNNSKVEILSLNKENDKWYRVRSSEGIAGYCYGDYLRVGAIGSGEKDLNNINRNDFINEFLQYHHAGRRCIKGLVIRRLQELDIFFSGIYKRLGVKPWCEGQYPIPRCAENIM